MGFVLGKIARPPKDHLLTFVVSVLEDMSFMVGKVMDLILMACLSTS